MTYSMRLLTRCRHSVVRASTWYADDRVFDDHVRQHSFVEIGHEIFSTCVLSLSLIQLLRKGTG